MPAKNPHSLNTSLEYQELKKKYDELQLRVTRFSVIEQELIHARNQMDKEVMIYRQMQQFNTKALEDVTDDFYTRLVTETLLEIFEIEVSFICIDIPNSGNSAIRHIEGYTLNEEQKFDLHLYMINLFADLPSGTLRSFEPRAADKIHHILPIRHLMVTQVRDPQLNITITLMGGITDKGSPFYEPIRKDREAAFTVFSQQVLTNETNRFKTHTIREQFDALSIEQKRITSIAENFLNFDTNPDKNIQRIMDLSVQLLSGNCSVYEKLENDLLFTSSSYEQHGFRNKDSAEKICYKLTHLSGRDIVCQQITEDLLKQFNCPWLRQFAGFTFLGSVLRIDKKPIGTLAIILDSTVAINDSIFQLARILTAAISVEERRKNALKALSESEEKYRVIFEGTPNGIIVADPVIQRIQYVNRSACQLFGYTEEEFLNLTLEDLHPADTVEEMKRRFKAFANGEIKMVIEVPCKHKNQLTFYTDISTSRISFGGRFLLAGFFTDVTQRRFDQQAIIKNNIELKKINSELDNFVYSVSHDLRSPLLAILGMVQLININHQSADALQKYISMIAASATRMDDTIKEILEYSRNARLEIEVSQVDFKSLIGEIFEDVRHISPEKITLELNIKQDTPFYSDRNRISTLIKNIISNAVKYRKKGAGNSFININILVTPLEALLRFEDNGEGIDEIHQERIFEMFYRASNSAPGTGLGLYICKEILSNIEGSITLDSVAGEGSVFTVTIKNKLYNPEP
ncbi:MAG TPA: PAS domain-containing sensor histidine kinase [Chitinophagaceae bacterium]|nr:PAS domain-containing sensor histidine kinase [Chitinophagaceae bacterium]HPH31792.1 PAS domain-containing sensor histidine kinase [Chitinophagaceae bacterium]